MGDERDGAITIRNGANSKSIIHIAKENNHPFSESGKVRPEFGNPEHIKALKEAEKKEEAPADAKGKQAEESGMKERPILFSGEMVRAILEGRKTQTRRKVKLDLATRFDPPRVPADVEAGYPFIENQYGESISAVRICPYGQPGDRLWVRERAYKFTGCAPSLNPEWRYFADDPVDENNPHDISRWKPIPSIHLPRKASRITLEITNVNLERLLDISEGDARKEGIDLNGFQSGFEGVRGYEHRIEFRKLWESINGLGSWENNPWVWVIEFKVL